MRNAFGPGNGATAFALLPALTASPAAILETALSLAAETARQPGPALPPDWLELALRNLGPLVARQGNLFDGQRPRRAQAARAVEELAGRFRGRLRAPAFGWSV